MELQGMGKQGFSEVNALIKFPQFPIHYGGRHWSPLGAENWLSGLKAWLWVLTSLLRTEHPLDFQTVKSCRPLPRKGPSENMTWRKRDLASLALPQHDQVPCSSDEILIVDSESPTTNYLSCFERPSFLTLNPKLSGRLVFLFFFSSSIQEPISVKAHKSYCRQLSWSGSDSVLSISTSSIWPARVELILLGGIFFFNLKWIFFN